MPRKKKKEKIQLPFKKIIAGVLIIGILAACVYGIYRFANTSNYFKIKTIKIDSSLQYIDKRDLVVLKRKNIFAVDLAGIQRKLELKYPQVSDLKIIRRFPNQILVIAKRRVPFAQITKKGFVLTLDEFGTVLSKSSKFNDKLSQIIGVKVSRDIRLGKSVTGIKMQIALDIIRSYNDLRSSFGSIKLNSVDVSKTSKIILNLSNKIQVNVDKEKIAQRMKLLSVVLVQSTLKLNEVKYIDLRFKEPIVGKK